MGVIFDGSELGEMPLGKVPAKTMSVLEATTEAVDSAQGGVTAHPHAPGTIAAGGLGTTLLRATPLSSGSGAQ